MIGGRLSLLIAQGKCEGGGRKIKRLTKSGGE